LILPYPKAVIFDWDDTLVDGWPAIHEATNDTLTTFGLEPWTYEQTRANVRRSMRDSFPELFGDRWEDAAAHFYSVIRRTHLDFLTPLQGAPELLRKLTDEGLYLGVVSNKNGDLLRDEVDHLGWSGCFSHIVGATDADRDKPDPAPLLMALQDFKGDPGPDIWFIGDAVSDMECAKRGRVAAVLIGEKEPDSDEFSTFRPDLAVKNAFGLAKYLDSAKHAVQT